MSRSIIERKNAGECFICGRTTNLHEHHVIYGNSRRKSEHYGLKVHLCYLHHQELHAHPNQEHDKELKEIAQRAFERKYSHELFLQEFERDYLA